ncbi:MAG: hypothetical protein ACXAC7_11590, partial [Candidatus Hodarchaeales archaeon]
MFGILKCKMIGIDTFSWGKLIRLRQIKEWKLLINEIIKKIDWFITTEGKKEFDYWFPSELDIIETGTILPVLDIKYHYYLEQGYDANDASLLEYLDLRNYRIITEDRPMLLEGVTGKRNIIYLVDFFAELT